MSDHVQMDLGIAEPHGPVVYFLEAVGLDRVKVGWSSKPHARIGELRTLIPCEVRLLKAVPGGQDEETELHRRFALHRTHGEWFRLSPIREAIEALEAVSLDVLRRCIDCGKMANKNRSKRNLRCRGCARKANTVSLDGLYECVDCGAPLSVAAMRKHGPRERCRSCAMRAAWKEPGYRTRIMAARKLQRRPCARCGQVEPKVKGKYHAACWDAELADRRAARGVNRFRGAQTKGSPASTPEIFPERVVDPR